MPVARPTDAIDAGAARPLLSRRLALGGSLGAAAAGVASPAAAESSVAYRPGRGGAKVLSRGQRHLVSRFSYGVTPGLAKRVRRSGGAQAWFEDQLRPGDIKDRRADELARWWPSFRRSPRELWERQSNGVEGGWEVMEDYARWVLLRRMRSKRQVLEVMTEFWENHLHVPVNGDPQFTHRVDYGTTIRSHALGRFDDLLAAAITHPAMLIYLNAAESTKEYPNENLGRELLELHTVGVGNYNERDVRHCARILTGWSVDLWESWRPIYHRDDHYRGFVRVKGFKDPNRRANGKAVTRRLLRYLAHHPDTAERIAHKLAVKFVKDDPPRSLVRRLARVYLANDTAIKPVLRELVRSREFRAAVGRKVRDPGEDVVATYLAIGAKIRKPPSGEAYGSSAVAALVWQASGVGMAPFGWAQPDGQPLENDAWSSPARLMASMRLHQSMAGGWWPSRGVRYREPKQWLPAKEVRFDDLVDEVSRLVLHRRSTSRLLEACCKATGVRPREKITEDHPLVQWLFPRFLTTVLDSPEHLSR